MRHKLDVPTIIHPRQRVPELTFAIDLKKLQTFIEVNARLLTDFLNIARLPMESLTKYLDQETISANSGLGGEYDTQQIIQDASDIVWSKHLKPKLINIVHSDIVNQAITFTHEQHINEVPFEEGIESRSRLMDLVADAITIEEIASQPIQFIIKPTYQLVPEDLLPYLNQLFTETVRNIFEILYELEAPLENALYRFYFNDAVPTKFSLDMLERYQQGTCTMDEIVSWAHARPDFWMQELLANANRTIERDPNVSADEKLTQKAACYQLLKNIFLTDSTGLDQQ